MFKAKRLHEERVGEDAAEKTFVASTGWHINFMKRFGLFLRRKANTIQKEPELFLIRLFIMLFKYDEHLRNLHTSLPI